MGNAIYRVVHEQALDQRFIPNIALNNFQTLPRRDTTKIVQGADVGAL